MSKIKKLNYFANENIQSIKNSLHFIYIQK